MSHEPDTPNQPIYQAPVNPLPLTVVLMVLIIGAIELFFLAAEQGFVGGPEGLGLRLTAIEEFAFYEPLVAWMIENETMRAKYMMRFVTYPMIQGNFTNAVFVIVFLLALGKWVGEAMGQLSVLVIFFGSAILGAVVYALVWDTRVALFGGYPGAYGLVGAFTFLLWAHLAEKGERQIKAFSLIAALLAIQFIFGLFFGAGKAWVAEVGGFLSGFGLAFLLHPGQWSRILTRVRARR